MKALVDADYYLYALGSLKDDSGEPREFRYVVSNFEMQIASIKDSVEEKFNTDVEVVLYITGSTNFRTEIATIVPYKGNRKDKEKPYHYSKLKYYITDITDWPVVISDNCEADDEVAIEQYNNKDTIICSVDKDLMMVPGWHYDFKKDQYVFVEEMDGRRWFYSQLLMGDSVDNIPGLFGVGSKSAHIKKLNGMSTEVEMFEHVKGLYTSYFGSYWEQFLTENARLLWMQQERDQVWKIPTQMNA